jgi:organic radical activating enzyme
MEAFYTIQGEGKYMGTPSYFIRLAACDVGCPFCDVKESWEIEENQWQSINHILSKIPINVHTVVVTGGEPLMHHLDELCKALAKRNIRAHIETSGSFQPSGNWDWFTLSPKKRKLPLEKSWKLANELKVVISRTNDFKFAQESAKKVTENCLLYLQPEWDRKEQVMPLIVEFVKKNPQWKISIQTHKYMDIP